MLNIIYNYIVINNFAVIFGGLYYINNFAVIFGGLYYINNFAVMV